MIFHNNSIKPVSTSDQYADSMVLIKLLEEEEKSDINVSAINTCTIAYTFKTTDVM